MTNELMDALAECLRQRPLPAVAARTLDLVARLDPTIRVPAPKFAQLEPLVRRLTDCVAPGFEFVRCESRFSHRASRERGAF